MCDCKEQKVNISEDTKKLAIAAAILFAGWKYGGPNIKAASFAIAAGIAGKRLPFIKDVI